MRPDDRDSLLENLKQSRRDAVQTMESEIRAEPDRMLPSGGLIAYCADIQSCIDAVEALYSEDSHLGG